MRRAVRELDFLELPCSGSGIQRDARGFVIEAAWALAEFGDHVLKRGWWQLECEGEGDIREVELRLTSFDDSILSFSFSRSQQPRTFLPTDRTFSVSAIVSPWPGSSPLKRFRFRQLTALEEAGQVATLLGRLRKSRKPIQKILHVASRAIGGRPLRVQAPVLRDVAVAHSVLEGLESEHNFRTHSEPGLTAVLRADEELLPNALRIVNDEFARNPRLKVIYSDVVEGGVVRPRPSWDVELARSASFASSPAFFRGSADAADPWSRIVSVAGQLDAIGRIPLPLASRRAPASKCIHVQAPVMERSPLVSVIIPTKTRMDLFEQCLVSLASQTDYPSVEVVFVDNGADAGLLGPIVARASKHLSLRGVEDFGPFNFSRLVNRGVREASGEVILLLNDDIEAIQADWLRRIAASVTEQDVGCVGARLLYPDRTLQHAGIMLGLSGTCGHLWKGLTENEAGAIPQVVLPSQRMAVTGACLAVRRELFEQVGGLDEDNFPVAFNDVDFCLRVRELGYRTIYRGDAVLIHHESQSRGLDDQTQARRKRLARETAAFLSRWGHLLKDDPFGSPAFDLTSETGAIYPGLFPPQTNRA